MYWNKETRNEEGIFYRRRDGWATTRDMSGHPGFTKIRPPEESLADNPIPCDWDEATQAWVLDIAEKERREASALLASTDLATVRQVEDLIKILKAKGAVSDADFLTLDPEGKSLKRLEDREAARETLRTLRQ